MHELDALCDLLYRKNDAACLEAMHSILNEILYLFKDSSYAYEKEVRICYQYPRVKANGMMVYSSRVVEDGSFLRLRNISLGYTLPRKVLRKMHFDTLRIYVSADNVFTVTDYSGPDPEVSTRNSVLTPGFDWSAYPRAFGILYRIIHKVENAVLKMDFIHINR